MRLSTSWILLLGAGLASAASWSFEDGTVKVKDVTEKLTPDVSLSKPINLAATQYMKILLTATNGKKPRRPHQAFLTVTDPSSGLEESYPFSVKETGKATVSLNYNSIPSQLLSASSLKASIVIADFGTSTPYKAPAFDLNIVFGANLPRPQAEKPLRYGSLPEIHHIFRADPRSPPKIVTLVFLTALLACVPALFIGWLALGANVNHLGKAMGAAPISHTLFFGSILAMEGVFFMYYTSWNLFQALPVASAVAAVAFVSGTKALTEVQERRLAGLR